jgi:hypothetical protein
MSRLVFLLIAAAAAVVVFRKATAEAGGSYDPRRAQ